jgi:hypothetical protein
LSERAARRSIANECAHDCAPCQARGEWNELWERAWWAARGRGKDVSARLLTGEDLCFSVVDFF